MENKYISVDVEASGKTAANYSMLSLGACIVGEPEKQFYCELKPINENFILEAMKIACLGLNSLDKEKEIYNPKSKFFSPKAVLKAMELNGENPQEAMQRYEKWVKENTKGFIPVEVYTAERFDGGYTAYYLDKFCPNTELQLYIGMNINSFYQGLTKKPQANVRDLGLRVEGLIHNALEDAIQQEKEIREVLRRAGFLS